MVDPIRPEVVFKYTPQLPARALRVVIEYSPHPAPDVAVAVAESVRLFESLVASRAMGRELSMPQFHYAPTNLSVISVENWCLSEEALWVLLRMWRRELSSETDGARLRVFSASDRLASIAAADTDLPELVSPLSFSFDFRPAGGWMTLQCEFRDSLPPAIAAELNNLVQVWADAASLGAFQAAPLAQDMAEESEQSVNTGSPCVGEDFVSWGIAMPGMDPASLNCVVNMLDEFSRARHPIELVYLG